MAYTYSDWASQASDADRLTRLRLHISEVAAQMGPDMSSGPGSISHGSLTQYLASLQAEARRLERVTSGANFTRGVAL